MKEKPHYAVTKLVEKPIFHYQNTKYVSPKSDLPVNGINRKHTFLYTCRSIPKPIQSISRYLIVKTIACRFLSPQKIGAEKCIPAPLRPFRITYLPAAGDTACLFRASACQIVVKRLLADLKHLGKACRFHALHIGIPRRIDVSLSGQPQGPLVVDDVIDILRLIAMACLRTNYVEEALSYFQQYGEQATGEEKYANYYFIALCYYWLNEEHEMFVNLVKAAIYSPSTLFQERMMLPKSLHDEKFHQICLFILDQLKSGEIDPYLYM